MYLNPTPQNHFLKNILFYQIIIIKIMKDYKLYFPLNKKKNGGRCSFHFKLKKKGRNEKKNNNNSERERERNREIERDRNKRQELPAADIFLQMNI